jgi:hypothetical protein
MTHQTTPRYMCMAHLVQDGVPDGFEGQRRQEGGTPHGGPPEVVPRERRRARHAGRRG